MSAAITNPSVPIPPNHETSGQKVAVMTPEKLEAILSAAQRLRENPLFEDYVQAVEEYRQVNNTVPDAD